ncbi:MAG: tyrosine protein phosphatase, partial [Planctomycetes bacterium]|nr:tyrosine protein phosphatase [Planctomycetota bacterium]
MIDIHSHILPSLDDGPNTFEESIEMCKIAVNDGISTIVATP